MNPKTVTLIVPIKARPEKAAEVRERLMELAQLTSQEPGNINYILNEDINNPGNFIIYENWQDQNALDFHMAQVYLKQFLKDSETLLTEEIKGMFCKVLNRDDNGNEN